VSRELSAEVAPLVCASAPTGRQNARSAMSAEFTIVIH
jgi:hypothetical protein